MIETNGTNLKDIVSEIEKNTILLPDFQREFKWKDEQMQKGIICSVLARMPIGSILILKSKNDEYACKRIGSKNSIPNFQNNCEVNFLLDGQQRLTVLANVFSNVIFEGISGYSELANPNALKRRFFLRIPRWTQLFESDDISDLFGIKKLIFPLKKPDSDEPDFLTETIKPFIECASFNVNDKTPYNPNRELGTALDNYCINFETVYLIPLFLLSPIGNCPGAIRLRFETITRSIADSVIDEIIAKYVNQSSEEEKFKILSILYDKNIPSKIDETSLRAELENRKSEWNMNIIIFLDTCVGKAKLNQIIVTEKNRARAIDIYENLNRGGISLNTFDLIMAKVAKESNENFYKRLIKNIKKSKKQDYPKIIPDPIARLFSNESEYNASEKLFVYNESKNEISVKYTDAFLNVAALCFYNEDLSFDKAKLENIKRESILNINSKYINEECENICTALDRAFFFFNIRCGIRNINEINYSLMITIVATIFMNDNLFKDKNVHDILEAWYWASLFSGEFDTDQNTKAISSLKLLTQSFSKKKSVNKLEWLKKISDSVFADGSNFASKELLLMERAKYDKLPKGSLRNFVCEYFLSKTYKDMFDDEKVISVFVPDKLEAHHLIPLGSIKDSSQIDTADLRNNNAHICNSPLNFVFITPEANKQISSKELPSYARDLLAEAKSSLGIPTDFNETSFKAKLNDSKNENEKEDFIKSLLSNRFEYIKGDVKYRISQLLGNL